MASRQEFAPWDGRWLAYDWFKLLIGLLLLLLLLIAWLTLGGPAPVLPRLRVPVVSVPAPDATVDVGGVTFSGDATPGSTVQLLIDGQPAGTVVAAPSGAWSLLIRLDRAGTYNVVARAIRPGGAVAATSAPQRMTVVATVSAISAPTLVLPGAAIPGNVMFSGAGAPGTTVEVLVDGRPLGRTTVGTDGRWSLAGSVPAGELQIVARALDATGAPAAAAPPATLFVAAPPVITSLADGAQATAGRLTIGGTGQPGSTIEIRNGTRVLGVATVGADGTWSFVYDAPPGDLRLTARIQGNDATASTPVRVTVNPAVAAAPPAGGTTGAGGTGSQTGAQPDIPAALPNTGTADNSWSALIVPATILLAGGLWLRGYLARRS